MRSTGNQGKSVLKATATAAASSTGPKVRPSLGSFNVRGAQEAGLSAAMPEVRRGARAQRPGGASGRGFRLGLLEPASPETAHQRGSWGAWC